MPRIPRHRKRGRSRNFGDGWSALDVDPNTCCGKPLEVREGELVCLECFTEYARPACPLCDVKAEQRAPETFTCPECKAEGFSCCVPGPLTTCLICQEDRPAEVA